MPDVGRTEASRKPAMLPRMVQNGSGCDLPHRGPPILRCCVHEARWDARPRPGNLAAPLGLGVPALAASPAARAGQSDVTVVARVVECTRHLHEVVPTLSLWTAFMLRSGRYGQQAQRCQAAVHVACSFQQSPLKKSTVTKTRTFHRPRRNDGPLVARTLRILAHTANTEDYHCYETTGCRRGLAA
jgi:hypothetical protein